jgi:hypothetical protein
MRRLHTAAVAVFLELLGQARAPMSAPELKRRLVAAGVEKAEADAAWRRAQPALRRVARFDPRTRTYAWPHTPPVLSPHLALDELQRGRRSAAERAELAEAVRAGLRERDDLEERLRQAYRGSWLARQARERQVRVDAMRALARVAMEVEELAAAGGAPALMVDRVRALAAMSDLEPIGRSGEVTGFDGSRHATVAGAPSAGARVSVIRPGYTWRTGADDVLLDRARVAPV